MIDDALLSSKLDRPRGNRRQVRQAEDGRPDPEGERHGRHPRNAPRGRDGAAQTMRRHRTDHSARSIAARLPGKLRNDGRSFWHALNRPLAPQRGNQNFSLLFLSSFRHTRLYKLTSRKFLKSNCESKKELCIRNGSD